MKVSKQDKKMFQCSMTMVISLVMTIMMCSLSITYAWFTANNTANTNNTIIDSDDRERVTLLISKADLVQDEPYYVSLGRLTPTAPLEQNLIGPSNDWYVCGMNGRYLSKGKSFAYHESFYINISVWDETFEFPEYPIYLSCSVRVLPKDAENANDVALSKKIDYALYTQENTTPFCNSDYSYGDGKRKVTAKNNVKVGFNSFINMISASVWLNGYTYDDASLDGEVIIRIFFYVLLDGDTPAATTLTMDDCSKQVVDPVTFDQPVTTNNAFLLSAVTSPINIANTNFGAHEVCKIVSGGTIKFRSEGNTSIRIPFMSLETEGTIYLVYMKARNTRTGYYGYFPTTNTNWNYLSGNYQEVWNGDTYETSYETVVIMTTNQRYTDYELLYAPKGGVPDGYYKLITANGNQHYFLNIEIDYNDSQI